MYEHHFRETLLVPWTDRSRYSDWSLKLLEVMEERWIYSVTEKKLLFQLVHCRSNHIQA